MPITPAQIAASQLVQHAAAQDATKHVRLVAGPGTGKSSSIEERVRWLLSQGTQPNAIFAVSFTRAAATDLKRRIQNYCAQRGEPAALDVRVSTLHSLALRALRTAGLLAAYPADPLVLDSWELSEIFDSEFGRASGIIQMRRCESIRSEHEAFWSTGTWGPPNYVPATPPITPQERAGFQVFHGPHTQLYSCVLPGEIVRQCVSQMKAGLLSLHDLLGVGHLIVDEFQDLNPMDLEFVDLVAAEGADVFVAGDDDQSIYSFRFAAPAGIQAFPTKYPACGQHTLQECFRCVPSVLEAAQALIASYAQPGRIQKHYVSLYAAAAPPVAGAVHRWRFQSGVAEANAVATSSRDLIAAGIDPREILILLSNQQEQLPLLSEALDAAGVPFERPRPEAFRDGIPGRFVFAVLRIVCDPDDYIAYRTLLGQRPGVGIGTCGAVADAVITNNLNYKQLFQGAFPSGLLSGRVLKAVQESRSIVAQTQHWTAADSMGLRTADIDALVDGVFGGQALQSWQAYRGMLPAGISVGELRDFLWADSDEQQRAVLEAVFERLQMAQPEAGVVPPRVRVMSMHGAKGLSAQVVFVPGLETELLPGPRRQPFPGLVLEAARLLYVSITRARASCVISYATTRMVHGKFKQRSPSPFAAHVNGPFIPRLNGLSAPELQAVVGDVLNL